MNTGHSLTNADAKSKYAAVNSSGILMNKRAASTLDLVSWMMVAYE